VYDSLRQEVVSGALPAGTRLSEPVLAAELSTSRTPVREALRRLEQDGLVEKSRGGGLQVAALTRDGAAEIMGIRSVLEGYAAGLAARRITAEELTALREAHRRAEAAIENDDLAELVSANTAFHDGITAAGHAPRCTAVIAGLHDWVLRYRPAALADEDARRRSFAEHAEILDALERSDAERVELLTRLHIMDSMRVVVDAIDD
jgi:DNA-binding GntR family transcriptional regulator